MHACMPAAVEMCACQREMEAVEVELQQRKQEVCRLQANLQEAERVIVSPACSITDLAIQHPIPPASRS